MRRILAAGLAALTFGGAVAAAAIPTAADAREWRGERGFGERGDWGHHRRDNGGAAVVAGIAGLAIGAALANSGHHRDYDRGYYDRRYYDRGDYGYGYGGYGYSPGYYDGGDYGYGYRSYAVCESRHWVWDPYIGRRVLVTSHYAC